MADGVACGNLNLWFCINSINRIIHEVQESQSAGMNDWKAYDLDRFNKYMAALKSFLDWSETQDPVDMPETSPASTPSSPLTEYKTVENEMIGIASQYLVRLRGELQDCQSMRQSTGLMDFDLARARKIISSLEDFVANYVEKHIPMDLPESSPAVE